MANQTFTGDKKFGTWLLKNFEQKMVSFVVPKIPSFIETYHLTLATLLWSALIVLFSYLAGGNLVWLWAVSLMILFQYLTDTFDGALGRYRKTGLVKWGFFMDHFLDFIFLVSIILGYSFVLSLSALEGFLLLAGSCGFMVYSFLAFASTGQFRISYLGFGTTEFRFILIGLNTLIIFYGIDFVRSIVPIIIFLLFCLLSVLVLKTQKDIWSEDMRSKEN